MASHLTLQERERIAPLWHQGANRKEIAQAVGRCRSTISRELWRNRRGDEYDAAQAQQEAERRRRERPLVRKMADPQINETVRAGLAQEWSPEQIAGRMQQQDSGRRVSAQTIYTWIKQDQDRQHWESMLRRRGKRPCRRKNTAAAGDAARIDQRPEVIEKRLRLGDFEGHTVLGPAGTGGLATVVDRKSRLAILVKVRSKNADHVHEKIKPRMKELDEQQRRSITLDNGTELARCYRLEKHLGMELYFAAPGCPFQRGTNENTNGLT
jgi:IS30 family transposase